MLVPQLLLETLENLLDEDFKKFKWYLSMGTTKGCKPIPVSRLETTYRTEIVSRMTGHYGEESAVNVTVEILRKMNCNTAAETLWAKYAAEGKPATPSTSSSAVSPPAAPATMSAEQGSVIVAPNVAGGTSGSWNITINK